MDAMEDVNDVEVKNSEDANGGTEVSVERKRIVPSVIRLKTVRII